MLNTEIFIKRNILYIRFDGELDQKNVEGLRFKLIELIEKYHIGYGAIPKPSIDPTLNVSSAIKVKYTGWLVDGTCFDYSDKAAFYLSDVILGWQDVLSKMPQGSYWRVYIPYERAYGATGSKGVGDNFTVPPYSTLIFDIELVDVINY